MTKNEMKARKTLFTLTALSGSVAGFVWTVLAGLVLFRSYTFFESVVVCLLVMNLSAIGMVRADFEPGGLLESRTENPKQEEDLLRKLRSLVKGILYALAIVMAVLKLVNGADRRVVSPRPA